jgi:divinyl chlorophyllide a 8-vinyl-reductase
MFQSLGKEPRYVFVPSQIFDKILGVLQYAANFTQSPFWEDALETAKIGKYYAVEDMLTTDPTEKYGTITVQDHFQKIATVGQDPFTPVRATAVIGRTLEIAKTIPWILSTIVMVMINTILSSPAMS